MGSIIPRIKHIRLASSTVMALLLLILAHTVFLDHAIFLARVRWVSPTSTIAAFNLRESTIRSPPSQFGMI
nr:MAG TPA: hypothetical protein [Caudoviricetes sp.]